MAKVKESHLWKVELYAGLTNDFWITTQRRDIEEVSNKIAALIDKVASDFSNAVEFHSVKYAGTIDA